MEIGRVLSVGHSNHSAEAFVTLLRGALVEVVCDVRSHPDSAYCPHFSQRPLSYLVRSAGIHYLYLGRELGGRPPEAALYDREGHVRYDLVADTARFDRGLMRLIRGCAAYRVALLCSEEDPSQCHRRLLIGRALALRGEVEMHHLRGDGRVVIDTRAQLLQLGWHQPDLFGGDGQEEWRSAHPVAGRARSEVGPGGPD
jgi:uncharacterized protein (DUF488 family)